MLEGFDSKKEREKRRSNNYLSARDSSTILSWVTQFKGSERLLSDPTSTFAPIAEDRRIFKFFQRERVLHSLQCKTSFRRKVFIDLTMDILFLFSYQEHGCPALWTGQRLQGRKMASPPKQTTAKGVAQTMDPSNSSIRQHLEMQGLKPHPDLLQLNLN